MAEPREVPVPIREAHQRITERPYESAFTDLPAEEVHGTRQPGTGPVGTVTSGGRSGPMLAFVVGFAVVFLTFFVPHPATLLIGVGLMLLGILGGIARNRPLRLYRGVGTVAVERQRR